MRFLPLRGWLGGAWLVLGALAAHAQMRPNLPLEPRANHGYPLALWAQRRTPGVVVQPDSTVFHQGRGSLRLTLPEEDERVFMALLTTAFPLDSVRGQVVTVSGWIRTRGFRGRAGIYTFSHTTTSEGYGGDHAEAFDSLASDTDWRRLELRLPVNAIADGFGLGMKAWGSGHVWFDDLQVRVGGKLLGQGDWPGSEVLALPLAEALAPNWDFERPLPRATRPSPARATAAPDSAQPQHGRRYLHLARVGAATGPAPLLYLGSVRLTPAMEGKQLQVKGYWRQPAPGEAPTLCYALKGDGQGSDYRFPSPVGWGGDDLPRIVPTSPAPGPQWTEFSALIPIPTTVQALVLSLRLPGGEVDVDNLSFALDGTPFVPSGPPTPPAPTATETAWLRTALKPLRLDAPATDFLDLAPLGSLVGPARLVGLGEAAPGSHEDFAVKSRLVRYLVTQKGFTGLLLDASPAASTALNDYLQTGQGDPTRLLAALGNSWNTAGALDLLRWLRTYNQAHPAGKVLLAGLDVQRPDLALAQLTLTVDATDDFAQTRLRQLRQLLPATFRPASNYPDLRRHPDQPQDSLLPQVHRLLTELATGLDTRAKLLRGLPLNLRTLARQQHYLRLIAQGATFRRLPPELADDYRAACLAENVAWQQEHNGGAKLLVWAANQQIAATASLTRSLGQWLRATYGAGYFALGFALGQGSYTTTTDSGHRATSALEAAPPGAYEAWLRNGPPAFLLPLAKLELTEANAWILQQQQLRELGNQPTHYQFRLHNLASEFDAVVFLWESTAARGL
ncbi:MAG: erythromycin esterase family protein [Janthinobacterium lividum]